MALTPKERMQKALLNEPVDRLPTQINYTKAMGERLTQRYQVTIDELPGLLGNHMVRLDISYPKRISEDQKIEFDWWGVGFDAQEEGYFTAYNPLTSLDDLSKFPWPDPHAPNLMNKASEIINKDGGQHFISCNFGFCLFERAWALRGFQNFLLDLALSPQKAEELFDQIVEIQLVLIRRFIDLGVDGGYFGDDYGSQKNLLFSPSTWRQMIKPRLKRLFAPFREAGLPVLMHSDGNIAEVLPDLVEIGLTTLNPVQPEVLDHVWLKQTFGNNLSYYGGVSTQTVLPSGSPEDVRQAVRDCIEILAPVQTGLVIAPSHRMMSDIPMRNVDALRKAFERQGDQK